MENVQSTSLFRSSFGLGESSGEKFAEGQSRQPRISVCHSLLVYQTDREDVALEKALELSKVTLQSN